MPSIFVSYRRTDAAGHAGRLYDRLVDRFGSVNVFKDLDSLEPGADFAEVINNTIAGCDALVAVIGRDWLTVKTGTARRLDDSQDWVRLEIANALKRNIRVIPVLVAGARMPSAADLPNDLQSLARRHALELSESSWGAQVDQLLKALEEDTKARATRGQPKRASVSGNSPDTPVRGSAASKLEKAPGIRAQRGRAPKAKTAAGTRDVAPASRTVPRQAANVSPRATPTTSAPAPSALPITHVSEVERFMHDGARSVAFSPGGGRIATAGYDRTARVWDLTSGSELACVSHDRYVWDVAFSPDGTRIATSSHDRTARIWEITSGQELCRSNYLAEPNGVAFSHDGARIATATSDKRARLWDASDGRELVSLKHAGFQSGVMDVAFSPDDTCIATAGSGARARVWEILTRRELVRIDHSGLVRAVTFSPDGKWIATGSDDNTARVWDIANGRELARVTHERGVGGVAFSPDGRRIATCSSDKTARVWDVTSGRELARFIHDDPVLGVAFSPLGIGVATVVGGADLLHVRQSTMPPVDAEPIGNVARARPRAWDLLTDSIRAGPLPAQGYAALWSVA